jgi:hypothetical protein
MRREDGMFIGDTSASTEASGVPFVETARIRHIGAFPLPDSSEPVRNPLNL